MRRWWVALLIVGGCGDPTLYPSFPAGALQGVDTAVPFVEAPLQCGRSDESTVAQLTVYNTDVVPYDLYTVDSSCTEVFHVRLEGETLMNDTVANHLVWSVKDLQGRRVSVFGLPSGSSVSWRQDIP